MLDHHVGLLHQGYFDSFVHVSGGLHGPCTCTLNGAAIAPPPETGAPSLPAPGSDASYSGPCRLLVLPWILSYRRLCAGLGTVLNIACFQSLVTVLVVVSCLTVMSLTD